MVHLIRYISAAALVSVSSAVPMYRRDGSAIGAEIPVSAPFGIPESDAPSSTDSSVAAATSAALPPPPPPVVSMASSMDMSFTESSIDMASMAPPPLATMVSSMDMASMDSASMAASDTLSAAMPQMTYGSGSSTYGSGYDSCVQQCAASNGMPPMALTPSATQSSDSSGGGSAVTHTVIVAPTQGVLRYIPFSTNASVGDTVTFVWGAGPHTVTQSSALEVCNKTSAPGAFASGIQNKTFVFDQVINDTAPIWFYCGIPTHCQKGMFGGINIGQPDPTGASGTFTPLSSVMANITSADPNMSALLSMTQANTAGNTYASTWGMSTNCANMTMDAMMQTAENVLYMQTLIAANPQAMQNGSFAVTNLSNLTIPADLAVAANSTMSLPSTASASGAATAAASSAVPAAASSTPKSNGAGSVTSSRVVVGLVAVVAVYFAF